MRKCSIPASTDDKLDLSDPYSDPLELDARSSTISCLISSGLMTVIVSVSESSHAVVVIAGYGVTITVFLIVLFCLRLC
mgnify:FL=1